MTLKVEPVSIARSPADIYNNAPIATSSHVFNAFTDVGFEVERNGAIGTDPQGGRADAAVRGWLPLKPHPLVTLPPPPQQPADSWPFWASYDAAFGAVVGGPTVCQSGCCRRPPTLPERPEARCDV